MLEPELKKKIINTISGYEKKCSKLEQEVSSLHQAMLQMSILPIAVDIDAIKCLQENLKQHKEAQIIQQQINAMKSKGDMGSMRTMNLITQHVNLSLQHLLQHLHLPEQLQQKLEVLKQVLQNDLNAENLIVLIDDLTDLLDEAFHTEQNRFKGFLQELSLQLRNFDTYIQSNRVGNQRLQEDAVRLEETITNDIDHIQQHIDTSTSVEEIALKVTATLRNMGDKMRDYRQNEVKLLQEYQLQIEQLEEKLIHAEQHLEAVEQVLVVQKTRNNIDSLTGLANRAAFDDFMYQAYNRWKRSNNPLSMAIADIDHFKTINDNFGHLAGDKVLKKVASIFKGAIREVDFIARFGGEEFVFIFESTTTEQTRTITEKLRSMIEDCLFCYRDKEVKVTVSFGISTLLPTDDMESLFIKADEAMYAAKKAGRNCIESL